jgi:hypothetical protein
MSLAAKLLSLGHLRQSRVIGSLVVIWNFRITLQYSELLPHLSFIIPAACCRGLALI